LTYANRRPGCGRRRTSAVASPLTSLIDSEAAPALAYNRPAARLDHGPLARRSLAGKMTA
jgi:hypothetical protein